MTSRDVVPPVADAGADVAVSSCVHPAVEARCREGACLVPAGCYLRGSPPDELERCRYCEDLRETTLTHALAVGQFEVTQAEWQAQGHPVRAPVPELEDGSDRRTCFEPSCPISRMTWFEAVAFANERSRREGRQECIALEGCTGKIGQDFDCTGYRQTTTSYYDCNGYRLPTSAEFEYIIRAGTRTAFFSGPYDVEQECAKIGHLMESAWFCANAGRTTHPVGQKRPNPWGIHDIAGNVGELTVSEVIEDTSSLGAATDPESTIATSGIFVVRGGTFSLPQSILRSAAQVDRHYLRLDVEYHFSLSLGFRLVRSLSPAEAASW